MHLDDVKAAVEASLREDFDSAFARFRSKHPGDLMEFLVYLVEGDQLSDQALEVISNALPELEANGTLAPKDNGKAATPPPPPMPASLKAKATGSFTKAGTEGQAVVTPPPAEPRAATQSTPVASPPSGDGDGDDDDELDAMEEELSAQGADGLPTDGKGRTMMLRAPRRKTRGATQPGTGTGTGTGTQGGGQKRRRAGERTETPTRMLPSATSTTGKTNRGYEFVGAVGEGAMGQVRLAKDLDLQRQVAYKVMSPDIMKNRVLAKKFYAEAQITAQLDHPNIVPIYALEEDEHGALAYSMKLIRGKTMEKIIEESWEFYDKKKAVDEAHALGTRLDQFLRVCDAVHFAHSRGVLHRDLKPENIMVGPYGEVYVMDWGIAKVMDPPAKKTPTAWIDLEEKPDPEGEIIIGTPQYMSPEQADGRTSQLDSRSDQYSLGLILYELVSLTQAVTGKSPMAIVTRQQEGDKNPLKHYGNDKIPTELRAIVEKSTQFDPDKRYPTVHELAEDVKRYLRGEAVQARPDGFLQALLRWMGHHRELTLLGIVGMMLTFTMLTLVSGGFYYWQRLQASAREEALTELLSSVGTQAALIDGQFVRYEGLLGTLAAASTEMLSRRPEDEAEIYFARDYDAKVVPDVVAAPRYGLPVSTEHPVYFTAAGGDEAVMMDSVKRLAPIRRYLKSAMLRSHDELAATWTPKRAERLLTEIGAPIAWEHVGLENGAYTGFPGHGDFKTDVDGRKQPWYELAARKKGPQWGSPYIDAAGLGLILPCAVALYDEHENFLGVTAIELTFDYIIEEMLELEAVKDVSDSFLVDDQGRVVIDSSKKGKEVRAGLSARTIRLPDFGNEDVRKAIKDRRSGYIEVHQDGRRQIILYQRMNLLGWYYVLQGDSDSLL